MQLSLYEYYQQLESPVARIFSAMSNRGIRIDLKYLVKLKEKLEVEFNSIDEEIRQRLGVENVNSDKQVIEALDKRFGLKFKLKGKPTRSKVSLEKAKHIEIVSLLLKHSELSTLLDTFVYTYLYRNTEILRPFFNQCGTRTGRPSCSNPNLLQIPKRTDNGKLVRRMFIPREGFLFGDCDYGQIEPRVLAHLSGDPDLCRMFNDGVDFHDFTSGKLRIDREKAKVLNLSVGYRATHKSVSSQLKCSYQQAQTEIDNWWSMFPGLYDWQQKLIYRAKRDGYCTTLFGRRIKIENLDSNNPYRREAAERQLINNITQGSAAEIMKKAMIQVDKAGIQILVTVYDELLFESPAEIVQEETIEAANLMTHAVQLDVPLTVDFGIGSNWSECK